MKPDVRRQIIDRARDLVEQGWCQGETKKVIDGRVCYCLVGAVRAACHEIMNSYAIAVVNPTLDVIGDSLFKELGLDKRFNSIGVWNDAPGRTQAEVVAVLRAVAGGEES